MCVRVCVHTVHSEYCTVCVKPHVFVCVYSMCVCERSWRDCMWRYIDLESACVCMCVCS